jgi:hypothetical protein
MLVQQKPENEPTSAKSKKMEGCWKELGRKGDILEGDPPNFGRNSKILEGEILRE